MKPAPYPVVLVFLALVMLSALPVLAAEAPAAEKPPAAAGEQPSADIPLVGEKVRQLMQDRKYAEAIRAIEEASKAEGAPKDYLAYLNGRALYLQKEYDQAVAVFEGLQKEFPKSPWTRRARLAGALALARKGDFRRAELIVRAEAEYLLSADRKQQIADIYLEFADAYFKPPKEEDKPDYKKALEFYQKALEVGPKPEKRIEVELLVAQCQQKLGQHGPAAGLFEKFIKDHAESPLVVEARFRLGECRLAGGKLKEARRCWQDLLAKHKDSQSERIAEATFQLSRTWKIPKPDNTEQLSLGTAALRAFIERFPAHKLASQAHLEIAQSNVHRGRYEDAVAALGRFLAEKRYEGREEVPDARNLLGRCYQLQKKFTEALATWREYLTKHPAHKGWSTVQRQIIDTEYLMAEEQRKAKQYAAARELWSAFLTKYPLDGRNANILYQFGWMRHQEEKWEEAITDWRRVVSKYPKTNEASQAQFMIAATLEQKLGKLEEALEEYRKVTWGNHAGQARQAIRRLTAKTMTVATERVFRSDEVPKLKLVTRNLETVTVRAYKVDMETYFRKMHLARGVEQLDIALIDPDKTFEFKVPDYQKYQQLESTIEVPLAAKAEGGRGKAEAGVMAVTVASKTLETTTLVIRSDLDVIVKSSRDEVFVFAENMLTGKPWAKVRLLVSNGSRVLAEAVTGEDGVLKQSYKELKDAGLSGGLTAGDVRVFAVADGHVASNIVGLKGVGVARGLADKGYIYTDRPAYRAGQIVHLRGCLRHAADDAYTIEKDKKYTVEVFDGRNRLVRQEEIKLSEFGSFHLHFVLPATSPQGQYRVLVRDEEGKNYQGTFQVHEYQLEPVHLVIDTPRHVYYRGEEIEGTIKAAYYYGAPLAGREIRYQLAGERLHTARTDEKGEVKFKLATREFSETQVLPLVVALPERNLQTGVNFVLAAQGFSIGVTTIRPVYVAGETFEATVTAKDAEGKPIARKLALKVLEQTTVQGKVGERLVEEHELETAEKDGSARQTLKLEKGARYVLRAEGTDRFKNPISGQYVVQVSDDEDRVRLRILADKHTFKVGDTAAVNLHWREEPALALVTFQGARVLDYKLVDLNKGANDLKIPMVARLAPNFELAVAVMTDPRAEGGRRKGEGGRRKDKGKAIKRFHTASSPFTVQRDLRVKIAVHKAATAGRADAAKGPVRPGEEVEVTVTTTDPQGKPVAAELSLAMVEQSLLERFPWQVAAIQDFFRGNPRQSAVRTTSSITFAYNPSTRPINPRLLAERDRIEVEEEEEESRRTALAGSRPHTRITATPSLAGIAETTSESAAEPAPPADGPVSDDAVVAGERLLVQEHLGMAELARRRASGRGSTAGGSGRAVGMGGRGFAAFGGQALGKQSAVKADAKAEGHGQAGWAMLNRRPTGEAFSANRYLIASADSDKLAEFAVQDQRQIVILNNSGSMQNLNLFWGDGQTQRDPEQLAAELAKTGAVILGATDGRGFMPQETGYWNPAIVTDKDGKATVKFTVPERSTAWKLLAKGITTETLAGEATDELTVKKDLFGELKLPLSFTDGDRAEILASVHNDAVEKGQIEVVLKTTIAGRTIEEKKTVEVKAKGIEELVFQAELKRPEQPKEDDAAAPEVNVSFELAVTAGEKQDVVRRTVPLKPHGMPVFATASGTATSDITAWVEAPEKMPLEGPSLQILVGPTVERSLLDIVLGPAPACQIAAGRIASGLETTSSDLMASLALQKLLGATDGRGFAAPQAQALDSRVRSSVSLLVSSQNDDGGWSWTGGHRSAGVVAGKSQRYISARIVWALSLARGAGYTVPEDTFNKALAYLRSQVAATPVGDYETHAILLQALSAAGRGDFAVANRLYRNRPALSPAALAYLALSFAQMDRKPTAGELLDLLAEQNLDAPASRRTAPKGSLPWSGSSAELRALYALGVQEVRPQAAEAKELVDWLLAHRTGHRWRPEKATGPAALALCRWFAQSRFEGERYQLEVFVNDVRVKVLEIDPAAGTQTIDVPARYLAPGESPGAKSPGAKSPGATLGKQRINFQIDGRGRYSYQCILGGFVPAEKLVSTTQDWRIERTYQPAPLEVDGREIPRGFGVLRGSWQEFKNALTQLPVGRRGLVDLRVWRYNVSANTPEQQLEYLVVTEPIPSGTTVIEKSVRGPFERFEVSPGAITFYIGSSRSIGTIHYELYGYLPGEYRAGPTVIRNAHRPEQLVVSQPKSLAVLPLGEKSSDKYRLTPQELYELGKHYFDKEPNSAGKHLTELVENKDWTLEEKVYKHVVGMLLDVHLKTGPPAAVVRYFEIIKEKWPAEEIPFEKIVKVGAAYHEMGEYERSYLVFRATVESSFMRESGVAGFLESQGEFARSVEVMGRLLREYPPEGYIARATYALAQRVYAKAPEAAGDEKLRKQKINRVDLVKRAWTMLEGFLTAYPEDPAADQAAFSAANALLELKDYQQATAACNQYAVRYPKSDLLDSYWYIIGYCHFATGEHQAALEMCRKVAEAMRIDKTTGREVEARNKWQAIYILGQVHHSLGQAAEAIKEYTRVEKRFADAKEAIAYFTRKAIELPEVTTVKPPGVPTADWAAEVELKFRNVPTCDTKVYRIDLMKFSLLRRNLGGITQINLAGIRPYHEATVKLGDGKDYRDRKHKLPLPLKEEGAYLVVCRGESLHTSGLVLVTPLAVEVQEDATSGRVRTTVKDVAADKYLGEVHVKVIGSGNQDFVSGETDLRGVFVADGIQGTSTVIAQIDPARYAFFRGQTPLAVPPPQPAQQARPQAKGRGKAAASLEGKLLEGLQRSNIKLQSEQVEQLKKVYGSEQQGVEAQKAF